MLGFALAADREAGETSRPVPDGRLTSGQGLFFAAYSPAAWPTAQVPSAHCVAGSWRSMFDAAFAWSAPWGLIRNQK